MFKKHKNLKLLLIPVAGLLPLFSAHAATADRELPVEIEADRASHNERDRLTQFSGNVVINQGSLNIRADRVSAEGDDKNKQFIRADGSPVTFRQDLDEKRPDGTAQQIKGRARKITFDPKKNLITMSGDARLDRDGDTVTGSVITYDTASSAYTVGGGGRVSVVLQPTTAGGKK